jgi:hypothetical protein
VVPGVYMLLGATHSREDASEPLSAPPLTSP